MFLGCEQNFQDRHSLFLCVGKVFSVLQALLKQAANRKLWSCLNSKT